MNIVTYIHFYNYQNVIAIQSFAFCRIFAKSKGCYNYDLQFVGIPILSTRLEIIQEISVLSNTFSEFLENYAINNLELCADA